MFALLGSWLNIVVISAVFTFGVVGGIWIGHKFFTDKVPWKKTEIKIKLPKGEIIRTQAIKYDGKIYYPTDFVNTWLRDKVGTNARLRE